MLQLCLLHYSYILLHYSFLFLHFSNLSTIGDRIRLMRNRAGYSQESFAKVCELNRTYIAGVETGNRNISIVNLNNIAIALNLTLSELCDVSVPANRTILLNINGQYFILESKTELNSDIKDHIDALCKYVYDEESEFVEELSKSNPDESIYDLSPYDLAGLFQKIVKEHVGIDVVFKGIDLEVSIIEQ